MSQKYTYSKKQASSYSIRIREAFNHWLGLFLVILAAFVIIFCVLNIGHIISACLSFVKMVRPVVYGCVIAYILNPLVNKCNQFFEMLFQRFGWKITPQKEKMLNGVSIFLSMVIAAIIIAILMWLIIPQIVVTAAGLVNTLPEEVSAYYRKVSDYIIQNEFLEGQLQKTMLNATDSIEQILMEQVLPWMQSTLLPSVNGMAMMLANSVMNFISVLYNLFIGLIVAIYLLGGKKTFLAQAKKLAYAVFTKKHAGIFMHYTLLAHKMFSGFIVGKIVDSTIMGIIVFVCMQIFSLPYAMLISVIVGVTNIIPVFGPYIGLIPSAFLIFLVNPMQALTFVIIIAILQQVDGNIIGPAILGESTGLSAFWVLFSILLFGGMWGLIGMIVGVPLFAVIYQIARDCVNWRLKDKHLLTDTEEYCDLKEVRINENNETEYIKYTEADYWQMKREKQKEKEENPPFVKRMIKEWKEKSAQKRKKVKEKENDKET